MGDFRATVKISWDCLGVHRECDMWINYSMSEPIDTRVEEFFTEAWQASIGEYEKNIREYFAEQNKAKHEAQERAEYERLKAKYEMKRAGPGKEA